MLRAFVFCRLAVLVLGVCLSAFASATSQRTFVASTGVDNPSCSLNSPCRGFAAAVTATSADGEVIVLDSAGYGAVTITKALSIIAAPGIYAGISVFAGAGVTIAAGPSDRVVLRGLSINGQGGDAGVHVTSGKETHIEDCTVANLALYGIWVEGGGIVHIARSVIRSNRNYGVLVQPATAVTIVATLTDSAFTGNVVAGLVAGTSVAGSAIDMAVTRSVATGNGTGYAANTLNLGTITLAVADSIASENGADGLLVTGTNATAIVSGSSFVRNVGFDLNKPPGGAVLRTAGNNALTGRGAADVFGTLTLNALK